VPRTVVVILEGAAPQLLEKWGRDGALPSFRELEERGTLGNLESLPVPYELPAQVTAFSGALPGEHGCFSLWPVRGDRLSDLPRVLRAEDVAVPWLWERWPEVRSCVVNLFGTHPPRPGAEFLITYPFYPTLHASNPPGLLRDLARAGLPYAHDASVLFKGETRGEFFDRVRRVEELRMRVCLHLLASDARLFVFNLTILDRLSHFWWREVETGEDDEGSILWQAYRLADRFLGEAASLLGPEDHLIVFSEFGFGPLDAYVSLNEVLAQAGLLAMSDGEVDYRRTVASEAVQGSHGINMSLRRRHTDGVVAETDEEARLREVQEALLAAANPHTGQPLIRSVRRGPEIYPGPCSHLAPDLVVEPFDERYQPLGDPRWATRLYRHLQTGWHRRKSFWIGLGPRFGCGVRGPVASCPDIACTLAGLLDRELPESPGRSLASSAVAGHGTI